MLCTIGAWRASSMLALDFSVPGARCSSDWLHVTLVLLRANGVEVLFHATVAYCTISSVVMAKRWTTSRLC